MKFLIVTHVIHKKKQYKLYAYEPYVKEMNLWIANFKSIKIIAPINNDKTSKIDTFYKHENICLSKINSFSLINLKEKFLSIFKIPIILISIFKGMFWADHIHLRCPGNIGLLGCFVQIFFPKTPKTVKYAGNWDPNSKQPWSYRLQKSILSNTFLTRNCKVLVYGKWKNQTKNIIPFFTASYSENEIIPLKKKSLSNKINLIFAGAFSTGKQPLKSVLVAENLIKKGYNVELNMFGDGEEFINVKEYVDCNNLQKNIFLKGNQPKEVVKKAFQESHFLVFISKSEGWPKVVAESMFWNCLALSTYVSCVPYMLDNGKRGELVSNNVQDIAERIELYINNELHYNRVIDLAKVWSQSYTLESFDNAIKNLL